MAALFNEKFAEIKELIQQHHPGGAKDECDNGINNVCSACKTELQNIKQKFIDGGASQQTADEFQAVIDTYVAQPE